MSIHILKTSHIKIKIGNSTVGYKLWFYIFYNTFESQMLHSVKALSPSCFSDGPFLAFHVGTSSAYALNVEIFPRPSSPLHKRSTPTPVHFTLSSMTLKFLSLVWPSDVNSRLRLDKALRVYICTRDLHLAPLANRPPSCLTQKCGHQHWPALLFTSTAKYWTAGPAKPTSRVSPTPAWTTTAGFQLLFWPPLFSHQFIFTSLFKLLQWLSVNNTRARDWVRGWVQWAWKALVSLQSSYFRPHPSLWQTRIMPTCLHFLKIL